MWSATGVTVTAASRQHQPVTSTMTNPGACSVTRISTRATASNIITQQCPHASNHCCFLHKHLITVRTSSCTRGRCHSLCQCQFFSIPFKNYFSQLNCPRGMWSVSSLQSHQSYHIIVWVTSATCSMQYFGCESVLILGIPPVICPSSNWDWYLYCSHGSHSSDW